MGSLTHHILGWNRRILGKPDGMGVWWADILGCQNPFPNIRKPRAFSTSIFSSLGLCPALRKIHSQFSSMENKISQLGIRKTWNPALPWFGWMTGEESLHLPEVWFLIYKQDEMVAMSEAYMSISCDKILQQNSHVPDIWPMFNHAG